MQSTTLRRFSQIGLVLVLVFIMTGVFVTHADSTYTDKRINQGDHLGGAVIYCQDDDGIAYNGIFNRGRIVVLQWNEATQSSTEVLEASLELVTSVGIPEAPIPEAIIASGGGYTLLRLSNGLFQLRGNDEYGKLFFFTWPECWPMILAPGPGIGPNPGLICPPPLVPIGNDCGKR